MDKLVEKDADYLDIIVHNEHRKPKRCEQVYKQCLRAAHKTVRP